MKKTFMLLVCLIAMNQLKAQLVAVDTLNLAKGAIEQNQLAKANDLLSQMNQRGANPYSIQLQAQVLYWLQKIDEASKLYETGIVTFPSYTALQLDYARMLFQLGKLSDAKNQVLNYISSEKHNPNIEAQLILAKIYLYEGRIHKSKWLQLQMSKTYPHNKDFISLQQQIKEYTAPYINLGTSLYSDDQPIKNINTNIESGIYTSWLFAPYILINANNIEAKDTYNTSQFSAGNKMYISPIKTNIDVEAGSFRANNTQFNTWKVSLVKKLSSHSNLSYNIENKAYQYTLKSIINPFSYKVSEIAFNYDSKNKIIGKIAYQNSLFNDRNNINTFYFWGLANIIKSSKSDISIGYAYAFSNAETNKYAPLNSISVVDINKQVAGIYNPYFTPKNQNIHSGIIAVKIPFSSRASFSTKVSVGFLASVEQPSLTVTQSGGVLQVNKTYNIVHYTPTELNNEMTIRLSKSIDLNICYLYSKNIFYTNDLFNTQLKFHF